MFESIFTFRTATVLVNVHKVWQIVQPKLQAKENVSERKILSTWAWVLMQIISSDEIYLLRHWEIYFSNILTYLNEVIFWPFVIFYYAVSSSVTNPLQGLKVCLFVMRHSNLDLRIHMVRDTDIKRPIRCIECKC